MNRKLFFAAFLSASIFSLNAQNVNQLKTKKENPAASGSQSKSSALPAEEVNSKTKLIETNGKSEKLGNIPYKKFELENGLTLIVHEDHSDPICHVDVTYHVGSAREEIGRSGFAHFFEHMMFQGTDNIADEEHARIISEAGGTMNGSTNTDRTNYFETMPNNQLEVALWLEADRMGFLLDAVTQQKFEVQRATVKNERGQNYDNKPYGLVREKVNRAMYPYGHPYSWLTIGDIEDLNRVDVNDLKNFFLRWYGPNNATLTVAGDVNTEEVVKLTEKYFGSIPRGPEVKNMAKTAVSIDADRYISYEDNIRFPMIVFSFPGVNSYDPDAFALDYLANIMGGTTSSIFYQKFVKTQLARQASVSNPTQELAGQFNISVMAMPGKSLAEYDKMIRTTIDEFAKGSITDADIQRYYASIESSVIESLSAVSRKAGSLAENQTYTGNPNYLINQLEGYKKVTKEDVMRVFNKYVFNKPAVILSVVPKGKPELKAKENNFTPKPTNPDDADHKEYQGLKYKKAKDNFDRSKKPEPGASPVIKVPDFWTEKLPNGIKMIGTKTDEVPMVNIQLNVACGHRMEPKEKAGIAKLMADLMNEATVKYTSEQRDEELELLGASIEVGSGREDVYVNISTPTKNLDKTLAIAEEVLLHSKFAQEDFDRLKNQQLQSIANQATQPRVIADNVFNKLLYGKESIMSIADMGSQKSVEGITLDDVKKYFAENFKPNIATMVVVGDIGKDKVVPKLGFMIKWTGSAKDKMENLPLVPQNKTRIYLVDKEKAPQSEIRIGYMALPFDATGEFYKAKIMNFPLGGSFTSRINLNLREKRGFTYGANSGFRGSKFTGTFVAGAGVKAESTDSSVIEFMREIKEYVTSGVSTTELEFTRKALGQKDALSYETGFQKAAFLKVISDYNLPKNFVDQQADILKKITKPEIDALAKKLLPHDKMAIVVVGDKKAIKESLSKTGYEIVELDMNGDPLPAEGNMPKSE